MIANQFKNVYYELITTCWFSRAIIRIFKANKSIKRELFQFRWHFPPINSWTKSLNWNINSHHNSWFLHKNIIKWQWFATNSCIFFNCVRFCFDVDCVYLAARYRKANTKMQISFFPSKYSFAFLLILFYACSLYICIFYS